MRMPEIEPTLNDTQVLEFCKRGFLMLEDVVPDEVNRRVTDYISDHPYKTPMAVLSRMRVSLGKTGSSRT